MPAPWEKYAQPAPAEAGPWSRYAASAAPAAPAADPTEGMSTGEKVLAGAGKAFVDTSRGLEQLAPQVAGAMPAPISIPMQIGNMIRERLTGRTPEVVQADINEAQRLDKPLMQTGAGLAGNVLGNVAISAPSMLAGPAVNTVRGAAALGALQSGAQPVAEGESRAVNTAIGGVGGAAGQGLAKLAGRAIQPVQSRLTGEAARLAGEAEAQGVPLTVGQATGSKGTQLVESALSRIPVLGKSMRDIQQGQREAFTRAASRTIGEDTAEVTQPVMAAARKRIGGEFEKAFAGTKLDANAMVNELTNVLDDSARKLRPDDAGLLGGWADDLLSKIDNAGEIEGKAYQVWRADLSKAIQGESNGFVKQSLKRLRKVADDEAYAKVPDSAALRQARQQWQNMRILEPLAEKSATGQLSPGLLLGEVRKAPGALGGDIGQLAKVGQAFVKEQIPDSGTAQRALVTSLLTGGAAGGLGGVAAMTDPETATKSALMAALLGGGARYALTNPAMRKYMTQGLASNASPQALAMARALQTLSRGGGSALAIEAVQ